MRTEFLCVSVLRVALGPRVKLASCKSALNPPVVCPTDCSKAVVPVLVLLFVALWLYPRHRKYVGYMYIVFAFPFVRSSVRSFVRRFVCSFVCSSCVKVYDLIF